MLVLTQERKREEREREKKNQMKNDGSTLRLVYDYAGYA